MNNDTDFFILNHPCIPGWFPLGHDKYYIITYHRIGFYILFRSFASISSVRIVFSFLFFGTVFVGFCYQCYICFIKTMEAFLLPVCFITA